MYGRVYDLILWVCFWRVFSPKGFVGFLIMKVLTVDDIAASKDILGEIILYKPLQENIFVYFIMSALYI